MESKRQQKFGKLIQKELAEIFQRDARGLFEGAFITITDVKMSPDLGFAKVYLSFLLTENKKAMLAKVREQKSKLRGLLGNVIKKQVRIIPELEFYIDDTIEHATRMEELFSKLNIPKDTDNPDQK
jgi:ribosome-binding factor A